MDGRGGNNNSKKETTQEIGNSSLPTEYIDEQNFHNNLHPVTTQRFARPETRILDLSG